MAYFSKRSRGEVPENIPLDITVWEIAKKWNKLPYEIWQMPASEFYNLIDMHNLEAKFLG